MKRAAVLILRNYNVLEFVIGATYPYIIQQFLQNLLTHFSCHTTACIFWLCWFFIFNFEADESLISGQPQDILHYTKSPNLTVLTDPNVLDFLHFNS